MNNWLKKLTKRVFITIASLVVAIFLASSVLLQVQYESYISESLALMGNERLEERHSCMPAIWFNGIRITTGSEYKIISVGKVFLNKYRNSSIGHIDAYFAKCYLTEAEIDSIYNDIQLRLNSRK